MKTLSEYVSWLNSMTTPELIKEFPGQFHTLNAKESSAECVKKMLANDAILWRKVKEYNQKLLSTEPVNSNNKPLVKADVSVSLPEEKPIGSCMKDGCYKPQRNCGLCEEHYKEFGENLRQ